MRALLAAFLGLTMSGASVGAEPPAPTVLIFDSSGSMAAREPDGGTKLDAARKIVADTLAKWPAGGKLAVIAYGHRRKSDCADIETLVGMAPVDAREVAAKLKPLQARGKTPISQSLRRAASLLPKKSGGTIVLVSDGIETCNADACAVARDLKRADPALTIHVVGFGLARGEAAQLACIAENAQGRFFDAGTAAQLADTLTTITETIASTPPPPATAPEPEAAPQPEPPRIRQVGFAAVIDGMGALVDAPVRWTVLNEKQETVFAGESRGLSLDLEEGRYSARAEAGNAQGETSFIVTPTDGQAYEVAVKAGRLDLALAASRSATPFSDLEAAGVQWTLEPMDGQGKVEIPALARPSLLLAPGRYRIGARLKGLAGTALATVTAGVPQAVTLDFNLGTIVLEAVLEGEERALDDAALLAWRVGEGAAAQNIAGQARPRLVLQEGGYPITLSIAGADISARADVRGGEERVARVVVKGGELLLSARLGPKAPPLEDWRDTFWTLRPADALAGTSKPLEIQDAQPTVPLPPGRWRLSLTSGTVTVERDILVAPGSKVPLAIDLGGARLTARSLPASGAPAANIVYSVFALDAAGRPAATPSYEAGSSGDVATILGAGRWRVIAVDSQGRQAQTDIELGIGDERTVEMTLN